MRKLLFILNSFFILFHHQSYAAQYIYLTQGYITIPESSLLKAKDKGIRMHTNYAIYTPYKNALGFFPAGETPASMACIYGFTTPIPGCPTNLTTALPTGGWGAIALVDAYDNPNAETDLNIFSAQFGLPPCTTANGCFSQIYATGIQPPFDADWALESSLDIEWAHAMAPNAKIILVEAASNDNNDLFFAENVASQLVLANGGGQVSNSWGGSEYPEETMNDIFFQTPGIVYFASSGDFAAPATYPASSPYVVSAGGTTIVRINGNFAEEVAWSFDPAKQWGSSGGPSIYESRPTYQNNVAKIVGHARGTPDISFVANPYTGVAMYSTYHGGWLIIGGTSVASPSLAGVVNAANMRANSSQAELTYIYTQAIKNYHRDWHDIIKGNNGFPALAGYDFVTGLGSPSGYQGK